MTSIMQLVLFTLGLLLFGFGLFVGVYPEGDQTVGLFLCSVDLLKYFIALELLMTKLKGATELITKDLGNIYKILDKLEHRISSLEKVLESHAKCIGEMRDKNETK